MKAIFSLLLLFLFWTTGCAAIGSAGRDSFAKPDFVIASDSKSSDSTLHAFPPQVALEIVSMEIDRTPLGSYVNLTVLDQPFQGTLLRKDSNKLVLVNCLSTEVIVDSDGQKYAKKSHTPFQTVEASQLQHFSILAPPSDKFAPKDLRYQAADFTVDAFKFHSGRIQRWIEPPVESMMNRREHAPEEWKQKLDDIIPGSQVAFLDESGQAYNAIVSSLGPDGISLLNCMTQESLPGHDVNRQRRTTCVPYQTIPIESISSCSVVSSALPEHGPASDDDHCDLCVTDIIYKSGRHQSDWQSARDPQEVMRILSGRPKWLPTLSRLGI